MAQAPQQTQGRTSVIHDYVAWVVGLGYNLKLNEITDQIEVNGKELTDELFSKIEMQLIEKGLTSARYARVAVSAMAYDNRYNPILEYLSKLPYDGGHYFDQLVACFDNPDGLFPLYLRKWMVGAISKTVRGTQNRMLILDGPQRIGKSLFVKWLCSGLSDYFAEGSIDADNEDTKQRLTSKWIWEVSELGDTFRKSDREALKNLITQQTMTFRRPYGRYDKTKPVLTNLIGTINNTGGFLDDPTGSRRFMVCDIRAVDWQTYLTIDVDKLWGEIYAAWLTGETPNFTEVEQKKAELVNAQYEIENPIELVIFDQYDIKQGDKTLWTSTADLMYVLQDHIKGWGSSKSLQMALASTCKKLGLEKGQSANQRGYFGIVKK